jgi:AraC-like DNA-binding protein
MVNKLEYTAAAIESSIEIMRDIVHDVRANFYFKPGFFTRNKYYEIELLERLTKYQGYSPIIDDYFLYYKSETMIYLGRGKTIEPGVFLESLTGLIEPDLWSRITAAENPEAFYVRGNEENFIFFVFPSNIIISSEYMYPNGIVMGFIIREKNLQKHITDIYGLEGVPMAIYFGDPPGSGIAPLLILPSGDPDSDRSAPWSNLTGSGVFNKAISVSAPEGLVHVLTGEKYAKQNNLIFRDRNTFIILIITIIAALCTAGVYMAFRNYRPIHDLEHSISDTMKVKETRLDELENIGAIFKKIKQEEIKNQRLIQGQLNSLKRQIVDIILSGGYNDAVQSRTWEMGMVLGGPWFFVLAAATTMEEADLWETIETISISGIKAYYGSLGPDGFFNILMDLGEDPSGINEAAVFFCKECKARGVELRAGAGPPVKNLSRISGSLLGAHSALQKCIAGNQELVFGGKDDAGPENIINGENWAESFSRFLRKQMYGEAAAVLDQVITRLSESTAAIMYQHYMYYNILSVMIGTAREMRININQEKISEALMAGIPAAFKEKTLVILEHICTAKTTVVNPEAMAPIMEYIRAHGCNYNMSLELLHEEFGFSITQLSHMIKSYSGESFRTYVTSIRMKKAQELLETDLPIAEIAVQVGYGSVSHFIKTFRTFYGKNPSAGRGRKSRMLP